MQAGLAAVNITGSELSKLQEKQRAAVERSKIRAKDRDRERTDNFATPSGTSRVHPDLQDLSFGSLGFDQRYFSGNFGRSKYSNTSSRNLQAPIRPSSPGSEDHSSNDRGSLSDFSNYDSSDEDTHAQRATSSSYRTHHTALKPLVAQADEDPFADPFAD